MNAGRELDALVAENVMGEPRPEPIPLDQEHDVVGAYLAGTQRVSPQGHWVIVCVYEDGDVPTWVPQPFSSEIAFAWEVVEKMSPDWAVMIENNDGRAPWWCGMGHGNEDHEGFADTAPLAICLAALKAVGVEV